MKRYRGAELQREAERVMAGLLDTPAGHCSWCKRGGIALRAMTLILADKQGQAETGGTLTVNGQLDLQLCATCMTFLVNQPTAEVYR